MTRELPHKPRIGVEQGMPPSAVGAARVTERTEPRAARGRLVDCGATPGLDCS